MDSIYTNTKFVIIAAASSDINIGLPGIGSTLQRITKIFENTGGVEFITT